MRGILCLLVCAAGCASSPTSVDYVESQRGYRVVAGYVKKLDGLTDPKIRKLKDGTAYTATQEGCTVVMYFNQRDPRTRELLHRKYELKPGDQFVSSRPFSYVLLKR